ncbi:hypothetical protein AMAG_08282 [Allomyces macrogynus ATCC 38327]|uniref:Rho-GAP domain-containing protein n=1 Tax=Allomyces macrogynus (strain ATCC 38327) TaxID=578462 RepID=A0A0L0SL06_ALLM3|nr:hypothetical protein AMAG_08282 [Allomyces macrogynus ATCC 38327]|eukprot:KNE63118.1 hypothetical protein AMAG_08282 [Allomyces macrogynus ATCC 38327]
MATPMVADLLAELDDTRRRLADAERQFDRLKKISRKALDEFTRVKEDFAHENERANRLEDQLAAAHDDVVKEATRRKHLEQLLARNGNGGAAGATDPVVRPATPPSTAVAAAAADADALDRARRDLRLEKRRRADAEAALAAETRRRTDLEARVAELTRQLAVERAERSAAQADADRLAADLDRFEASARSDAEYIASLVDQMENQKEELRAVKRQRDALVTAATNYEAAALSNSPGSRAASPRLSVSSSSPSSPVTRAALPGRKSPNRLSLTVTRARTPPSPSPSPSPQLGAATGVRPLSRIDETGESDLLPSTPRSASPAPSRSKDHAGSDDDEHDHDHDALAPSKPSPSLMSSVVSAVPESALLTRLPSPEPTPPAAKQTLAELVRAGKERISRAGSGSTIEDMPPISAAAAKRRAMAIKAAMFGADLADDEADHDDDASVLSATKHSLMLEVEELESRRDQLQRDLATLEGSHPPPVPDKDDDDEDDHVPAAPLPPSLPAPSVPGGGMIARPPRFDSRAAERAAAEAAAARANAAANGPDGPLPAPIPAAAEASADDSGALSVAAPRPRAPEPLFIPPPRMAGDGSLAMARISPNMAAIIRSPPSPARIDAPEPTSPVRLTSPAPAPPNRTPPARPKPVPSPGPLTLAAPSGGAYRRPSFEAMGPISPSREHTFTFPTPAPKPRGKKPSKFNLVSALAKIKDKMLDDEMVVIDPATGRKMSVKLPTTPTLPNTPSTEDDTNSARSVSFAPLGAASAVVAPAAVTPVGDKSHIFIATSFSKIVKCGYCNDRIWGMGGAKEMSCRCCGYIAHMKCAPLVPPRCPGENKGSAADGTMAPLGAKVAPAGANGGGKHRPSAGNAATAMIERPDKMFGTDLTVWMANDAPTALPVVVEKGIQAVEAIGMDYEGVYRKSGPLQLVKQAVAEFEKGAVPNLADEATYGDVSVATSVVKQYLRDLPNPLITFGVYPLVREAMLHKNAGGDEAQQAAMRRALAQLPPVHHATLTHLMRHLRKIADLSSVNKMTPHNLAVVFGPTLMRDPTRAGSFYDMTAIDVVEYLLDHHDPIFAPAPAAPTRAVPAPPAGAAADDATAHDEPASSAPSPAPAPSSRGPPPPIPQRKLSHRPSRAALAAGAALAAAAAAAAAPATPKDEISSLFGSDDSDLEVAASYEERLAAL